MTAHRRRYQLGFGVALEFIFRPAECQKGALSHTALVCEWTPAVPKFPPGNALNKFMRKYHAVRDDFLRDVAQLADGGVAILYIGHEFQPSKISFINPVVPS